MSIEMTASSTATDRVRQDFPDWVSPIVVKELRQGLRARGFTVSLILLHSVMAIMFLLTLADASGKGGMDRISKEAVQGFFWFITAVPILLILPFAGASSINHEIKSKTIELVRMTHMDWLSVVRGKFLSTLVQIGLLAVSLLPYFGFRYFFGRVDLLEEVYLLFMVVVLGCVATSCFLVLTVMPLIVRIFAWIQIFPVFLFGGIAFLFNRSSFDLALTYDFEDLIRIGMIALISAAYVYYFILLSATLLSKAQYTWSGQKRVLGALAMLVVLLQLLVFKLELDASIGMIGLLPLLGMIVTEGLLYRPALELRDLRNYRRAGNFWSKFSTLASIKGWPTHVFYLFGTMTLSLFLLSFIRNPILDWVKSISDSHLGEFWSTWGLVVGAWLAFASLCVHLVVARLFRLHRVPLFYVVVGLWVLMFVVSLALGLLTASGSNGEDYLYFLSVFSPIAGLDFLQKADSYRDILVSVPMILSSCYILYTLFGALRWLTQWLKSAKQIES